MGRWAGAEACWLAAPGRHGVVGEAAEEEQREGWVEAVGERKRGKKVGACCCERGREVQRTRGRSLGAPSPCEAR